MQLREYQQAAVKSVWDYLCFQPGNPLVVMPTGSGKSPVIGAICQEAVEKWKGRVIVLAHRKELLEQNADKIRSFLPALIPVGLHSAGLRRFATDDPVICAGIQSIYKKASLLGARNLAVIDEAHLVPGDGEGMYQTFLSELREINPKLRVVGLTATPFRTDAGSLCGQSSIFQRVCHEVPIKELIDEGWLCPLTSSSVSASIDTSKLHVKGGEFVNSEAEREFDVKVPEACREIATKTAGRKSILIFCQGVNHAGSVRDCLERVLGHDVGLVTGSTPPLERDATLRAFREQRLRACVNVDVLTTGFDAPVIDAIAVLRATMSAGLFAQMVGRGLRLSPSKADCLILDFGENVMRHGKLDDPSYGRKKKETAGTDEAVKKECPNCGELVFGGSRECKCGYLFPEREQEIRHNQQASDEALIGYKSDPEWFLVETVFYNFHKNKQGICSMRVDYDCRREEGNLRETVSEWVCFEHEGFARKKAALWWMARSQEPCPSRVEEAIQLAESLDEWKEPVRMQAHKEGRFWKIDQLELQLREPSFEFGENTEEEMPF